MFLGLKVLGNLTFSNKNDIDWAMKLHTFVTHQSSLATTVLSSVTLHTYRGKFDWQNLVFMTMHEAGEINLLPMKSHKKKLFNNNGVILGFSYLKQKPTHMFWKINQTLDIKRNLIGKFSVVVSLWNRWNCPINYYSWLRDFPNQMAHGT